MGVAFVATALLGAIPAPLNSFGLREELHAALADLAPRCCSATPSATPALPATARRIA
jgi:long-chain acyl-CoA synthetase